MSVCYRPASDWLLHDYRCSTIRQGATLLHLVVKGNSISATLNELLLLPINIVWSSEGADVGLIPRRQEATHGNGASLVYNINVKNCSLYTLDLKPQKS